MYYSLSSARVFFRADKTEAEEKEEKEQSQGKNAAQVEGWFLVALHYLKKEDLYKALHYLQKEDL